MIDAALVPAKGSGPGASPRPAFGVTTASTAKLRSKDPYEQCETVSRKMPSASA